MTPGAYAQRTAPPQHAGERCRYLGADETGSLARILHEDGTIGYVGADEICEVAKEQESAKRYVVVYRSAGGIIDIRVHRDPLAARESALDLADEYGCPDEELRVAESMDPDGFWVYWSCPAEAKTVGIFEVTEQP